MYQTRAIWRAITIISVVFAVFAATAASADAAICNAGSGWCANSSDTPHQAVPSNYDSDYAYVYGRADCPLYAYCFVGGEPTIATWTWSNGAWTRSSLRRDERVWVRSFGSGWSWAYTPRLGYVAIQTTRLYTLRQGTCATDWRYCALD